MKHFSSNILMISPDKFRSNELTLDDNVFQSNELNNNNNITKNALLELEELKKKKKKKGINIYSFIDDSKYDTPDAVFPNNWISFHKKNNVIIHSMFANNRRFEKMSNTLLKLSDKGIDLNVIHDYSSYEKDNKFLEGTGSLVLDRKLKIAYCSLSMRSNEELFNKFCTDMNYRPLMFNAAYKSKPIYHTNVLMSICNNFSIICLESISDNNEKQNVIKSLENSNLDIIDITLDQMNLYLGNCIQLINSDLNPYLVMSTSAFRSIKKDQLSRIINYTDIIHSDLKVIENNGGGSARCMIAEIF